MKDPESVCRLRDALESLATLDQVPAVEWEVLRKDNVDVGCYREQWHVYGPHGHTFEDGVFHRAFHSVEQAKRYVEIKLHLAEIERKLLKELVEK